jgi:hypothetical protein
MVPKPFSRVVIRFGKAIDVPAELEGDAFEQKRVSIEQRLKELYEDTDRMWSDPVQIAAIFSKWTTKRSGHIRQS